MRAATILKPRLHRTGVRFAHTCSPSLASVPEAHPQSRRSIVSAATATKQEPDRVVGSSHAEALLAQHKSEWKRYYAVAAAAITENQQASIENRQYHYEYRLPASALVGKNSEVLREIYSNRSSSSSNSANDYRSSLNAAVGGSNAVLSNAAALVYGK